MAFGATPKDSGGIPIAESYVPGTGFIALKGSPNTNTDGSSNTSTAAAMMMDQALVLSGQLQNAQTTNANGSTLTVTGMGSAMFEVIMTGFSGNVFFEGAGPNGNYDPIWTNQQGTNTTGNSTNGSTTTATHLFEASSIIGLQTIRARTGGVTAGNVTVNAYALPMPLGPRAVIANLAQVGSQPTAMMSSDGQFNGAVGMFGVGMLDNAGNIDRQRNNLDNIVAIVSAAYTTTQTTSDQTNFNHRGIIAVLNVTVAGTGSVTLEIDGKDPVSGAYYAVLTGVAVTTNSTNVYRAYPGLTASANATANDILPRTWRIKVTANNANTITYSVGCILIL